MAMIERFCPTCNAEVQDAGGFCLLGHPLRLAQERASLSELRAEVDHAFDEARSEVAELLAATAAIGPSAPRSALPPPPPPPTTALRGAPTHQQVSASDPITAFSPPPRMDWGPPERPSRFKRRHPRSEA